MAETPETNKPDFRDEFPIRDPRDGSMISGQTDGEEVALGRCGRQVCHRGASEHLVDVRLVRAVKLSATTGAA
jgi:hypothetical protein